MFCDSVLPRLHSSTGITSSNANCPCLWFGHMWLWVCVYASVFYVVYEHVIVKCFLEWRVVCTLVGGVSEAACGASKIYSEGEYGEYNNNYHNFLNVSACTGVVHV